jgi:hypothetical protein
MIKPCKDHLGKEHPSVTAMCKAYGVTYTVYINRISRGWTKEASLTTPVGSYRQTEPYYARHKDDVNEYSRLYHQSHKEEIAARKKAYYEANKEQKKAYQREYNKTNKSEISARRKAAREGR